MTKAKSLKQMSMYELEERLSALHRIKRTLYEYMHVFNHDNGGEGLVSLIAKQVESHESELDARYEENEG
jgi:hypothetical protein